MYETDADLAWLQSLLDRSYEEAGRHLRSITTPDRRIPAAELGEVLRGMVLLNVATVTAAGEPRIGPVDGLFFRGRLHFGSSRTSARYRHLVARPQVSASHTPGVHLSVAVHGTAHLFSLKDPDAAAFRAYCEEVFVPLYGEMWNELAASDDVFHARIEPAAMFTFRMEPPLAAEPT
jgi:uncharacterized pyridoxamine 5'-phosphate oxidase family protein